MLGGGGILGVGPAEMVVVFGVGWLVLGPTKLFALSRDVGRVVGDLRRSAIDASSTFTDAMEGELRDAEEQEALAAAALAKATAKAAGVVAGDEDEEEAEEDEEELAFVSGPDVGGILRDVSDTMVAGPAAAVAAETDAAALGVADRTVGGRLPDLVAPTDAVVTRARFMEQLSRANDPEQQAEADIVGATLEEDVEVARLEYELVKARLAAKRRQEAARVEEASVKGGAEAEE
jgi:Sec-independent protein translocase protein TatA